MVTSEMDSPRSVWKTEAVARTDVSDPAAPPACSRIEGRSQLHGAG